MASTTDIATFRRRIGDEVKSKVDAATFDGTSRVVNLTYANVYDLVVDINGVENASGWTEDLAAGVVTFNVAPVDGNIGSFTYLYAAYSDAQAGALIDAHGIDGAVIEALRELLANAARLSDYTQGPTEVKQSQVYAQLSKLLDRYESIADRAAREALSNVSIGERTREVPRYKTEFDLSRLMDEEFLR